MSSTNKTPHLELNSWVGSDIPKMADFNADNSILDAVIAAHTGDTDRHTTAADQAKWNSPYAVMYYTGNGSASRTLTPTNDFEPTWGFVFKLNYTPTVVDIANQTKYNYFGFFSNNGSNAGLSLSGKRLTVQQSSVSVFGNELKCYNENGSGYMVLAFR